MRFRPAYFAGVPPDVFGVTGPVKLTRLTGFVHTC